MNNVRAIRVLFYASVVVGGLGFSGGCGGEASTPNGGVIAEDPKIYQDREKAIRESYKKTPPPSPFQK